MSKVKISVAIIDDHNLLRHGFATMINHYPADFHLLFEAVNGNNFIEQLDPNSLPDVVIVDIDMPVMDGIETTLWIKQHHPQVRVLALTLDNDRRAIKKMMDNGASGYVFKTAEPRELKEAIEKVVSEGFYYSTDPFAITTSLSSY